MIRLAALWMIGCTPTKQHSAVGSDVETHPRQANSVGDAIRIDPRSIHWDQDSHTVSVAASLVGEALAHREEVVYVGVTVVTEDDQEVDLLVHTLFPGAFNEELVFTAELPSAAKHVLIGAWDQKIKPCEVARPGCKEFGFVLDGSLASFPARLYSEGMRQRMLPAEYPIAVAGSSDRVQHTADAYALIFGSKPVILATDAGGRKPGVWAQRPDDLGLAHAIAAPLGLNYGFEGNLGVPMLVVLPE